MINISFDRPLFLLIAIPLLLIVLIPFLIAIRKENRTKSSVISLVLHLLIAAFVTFVAAGTSMTRVITETNVYVIADVSHSTNRNLDLIDEYVKQVEKNLPANSKMGVIAFGDDAKLITELGEDFDTVKDSGVDDSATNIKSALDYAASLFENDVVRRIVLITDGKQTSGSGLSGIARTIDNLYAAGVYVDAIYIDDNTDGDDSEVQITTVDFTATAYLNHESVASVLVQSASEEVTSATVRLYKDGELVDTRYPTLTEGYNVINFSLPTDESGDFDYSVSIVTESGGDSSNRNNTYTFTQTVSGKLNVLLVSSKEEDVERAEALYGEDATIDAYVNDPNVPCTVERLIKYDEIILSDVDVRELANFSSFISSVDTVVSTYGKSLMTFGDLKIQNKTDDILKELEDMLPVQYGNSDQDSKLLCLVIDASRSMEQVYKLIMAKTAACRLVDLMNDRDFVVTIAFWGDYTTITPSTPVGGNREDIKEDIMSLSPKQNTVLSGGMREAYEKVLASSVKDRQIFLMTDGLTWSDEADDPVSLTKELYLEGIPTSVLNTGTRSNGDPASDVAIALMQTIAKEGCGQPEASVNDLKNYYYADSPETLEDILLAEIADEVTDTIIEGDISLNVKIPSDAALDEIDALLPNLGGFVYSSDKKSATTVLTADYTKANGGITEAPIYAYWQYGDGRVTTFTSSLSGEWVTEWTEGAGRKFIRNVLDLNVPEEKHDYPFTVGIDEDGGTKILTLTPDSLVYGATATISVKLPSGKVISDTLTFNSKSFGYEFEANEVGKYAMTLTYTAGSNSYSSTTYFDIPYETEYNSFTSFSISDLHKMIRTKGTVHTDADFPIENDEDDVATYTFFFAVPLMVLAVILYVADIMVRKLRWADIVSLFGKSGVKRTKGGTEK